MVTNLTCIFCKKALTVGQGADFKNGRAKSENHVVDDIVPVQVDNNRQVDNFKELGNIMEVTNIKAMFEKINDHHGDTITLAEFCPDFIYSFSLLKLDGRAMSNRFGSVWFRFA